MVNSSIKAVSPQKCLANTNSMEGWSSGTSLSPYFCCRSGISAGERPEATCTVNSDNTSGTVFASYGLLAAVTVWLSLIIGPLQHLSMIVKLNTLSG